MSKKGPNWNVRHLGADLDYRTKVSALNDAIHAANVTGAMGYAAEVVVRDADGQWQTDWTYGRDRYPRNG